MATHTREMKEMEAQLKTINGKLIVSERQAEKLRDKEIGRSQDARQRAFMSNYFAPAKASTSTMAMAAATSAPAVGYTVEEVRAQQSDRTFRRNIQEVHLQIMALAGEDPLKQVQLADAVWKRFVGAKDKLLAEEVPMARIVLQSLQDFFAMLQQKHHGRYPSLVRSAFQGVCAAVMTAIPRGKRKALAETLGVSDKALKEAQVKLELYRAGEAPGFITLRGETRSDTMPQAWRDNCKSVCRQ